MGILPLLKAFLRPLDLLFLSVFPVDGVRSLCYIMLFSYSMLRLNDCKNLFSQFCLGLVLYTWTQFGVNMDPIPIWSYLKIIISGIPSKYQADPEIFICNYTPSKHSLGGI